MPLISTLFFPKLYFSENVQWGKSAHIQNKLLIYN